MWFNKIAIGFLGLLCCRIEVRQAYTNRALCTS